MPTHIRAQVQWQVGSMLPRDIVQITPCFRHQLGIIEGAPDWDTLADDLCSGIVSWGSPITGNSHQVKVKLYEIGAPPRTPPRAIKTQNANQSVEATGPRELAVCLSFYGGSNQPRNRGRLYIPGWMLTSATTLGPRPTDVHRSKAAELPALFAGLGGTNVDWIVWSPTRDAASKVTNWWVDDEWDVQRRRGLRPVARTSGTTGG